MLRGSARILIREAGHRKKFHTWFPLKSSTAMAWPKFQFRGDIHQKCTHQRLLEIFKKFLKNLHKNLMNSPNFIKTLI